MELFLLKLVSILFFSETEISYSLNNVFDT